jgi:CBS domain-containing protein
MHDRDRIVCAFGHLRARQGVGMTDVRIARIRGFMTRCPHTIDHDVRLQHARERMQQLDCRHLPVVRDGRLVGVLSERDIDVAESLRAGGADTGDPRVVDAMSPHPFTCGADAHLHAVAKEMAAGKYGCAIVLDAAHPTRMIGVFTTTDALLALSLLAPQEAAQSAPPSPL